MFTPEPWVRGEERFRTIWTEQYVRTYLERDVGRLFAGIDSTRFRLFLQTLASLSGTIINYSEVARSLSLSQPTVRDYFDIADGTFVWRKIPSFERDATKRIVKHPRGYHRDSGLLNHLLRIHSYDALISHPSRDIYGRELSSKKLFAVSSHWLLLLTTTSIERLPEQKLTWCLKEASDSCLSK